MNRVIPIIILALCAAILSPHPVLADGGGWPTATPTFTPTFTPTYTPLPPASIIVPPVINAPTSVVGITGVNLDAPPAVVPSISATPTPLPGAIGSLAGTIACWPIAIIALVVGLALFTWLRSGMRQGN